MPHLLAAPDKYRGSLSARAAASAMVEAALRAGWSADAAPMSDGGEGLLDVLDPLEGDRLVERVEGPLGDHVAAEWLLVPRLPTGLIGDPSRPGVGRDEVTGPSAIIEMAQAAGRMLLPSPRGDDPVRASTAGVGQLIVAARDAGARRIIVGCGGSATTDGGQGAFDVVGSPAALRDIELIATCDVTGLAFIEAARAFGPQKGATDAQIEMLERRLVALAERYRRETGVDVTDVPSAGVAGGLGGGLVALGARLVRGFDFVAGAIALPERVARADLVATGEGHLDPASFRGKVVGGVLDLASSAIRARHGRHLPTVCVAGDVDQECMVQPPPGLEIANLTARVGRQRAENETARLIGVVISEVLDAFTA